MAYSTHLSPLGWCRVLKNPFHFLVSTEAFSRASTFLARPVAAVSQPFSLRRNCGALGLSEHWSGLENITLVQAKKNHTRALGTSARAGGCLEADAPRGDSAAPTSQITLSVELTPNPQARKFVVVNGPSLISEPSSGSSRSYTRQQRRHGDSPLADCLFKIDGTSSVLIAGGYVTVVKARDTDWKDLEEPVKRCIQDHLTSGIPAVQRAVSSEDVSGAAEGRPQVPEKKNAKSEEEEDLSEAIRELLHMRARPMLQADGGDLEMMRFDEETGIVWVHLKGSCEGCPSSLITVKRGMKQMLQYYIPEVRTILRVDRSELEGVVAITVASPDEYHSTQWVTLPSANALCHLTQVEDVRQCDENGDPLEDDEE
ncbi:NifU family domain-containing protein [Toxoplasma gondii GAB2-2007-GAL-DOM2]|uniref:NifU family domain-containing protein n=2 Tax=Toxoplasma gondii TaxID=5811 RepID=V5B4P3_TOXGV|nr:NifU family domain-containing protein [Toxoplasma gondii VEG]KFG40402.1 NifU family domain-containing protein [Toxoplasma gondii GAB2-2007-GAL-DOM2]